MENMNSYFLRNPYKTDITMFWCLIWCLLVWRQNLPIQTTENSFLLVKYTKQVKNLCTGYSREINQYFISAHHLFASKTKNNFTNLKTSDIKCF